MRLYVCEWVLLTKDLDGHLKGFKSNDSVFKGCRLQLLVAGVGWLHFQAK